MQDKYPIMIKKTERVNLYVVTEIFTMENGRMTNDMAMEFNVKKMEGVDTMVNILMVREMERAH